MTTRGFRFAGSALVGLFLLALGVGVSGGQPYGGGPAGGLTVSNSSPTAGITITITGTGYAGNVTVQITFTSAPVSLGTATTDASGAFTRNVVIPTDATVGVHEISAAGNGPDGTLRVLRASVTVISSGGGGGGLIRTGTDVVPSVLAAAACLSVGTLLVLSVRRRRATAGVRSS